MKSFTRFFFTYRGKLLLPLIALMLINTKWEVELGKWKIFVWIIGLIFVILGVGIRIWAQQHIKMRPPKGVKRKFEVAITGPYLYVRNPLYIGNIAIGAGFCILSKLLWIVPFFVIGLIIHYRIVIAYEEEHLKERYGDPYKDLLTRVPRWIPNFKMIFSKQNEIGSHNDASIKEGLVMERHTIMAVTLGIIILSVKEMIVKSLSM